MYYFYSLLQGISFRYAGMLSSTLLFSTKSSNITNKIRGSNGDDYEGDSLCDVMYSLVNIVTCLWIRD